MEFIKQTFFCVVQSSDGQPIFLHALNVQMLVQEYGTLENCPPVIRSYQQSIFSLLLLLHFFAQISFPDPFSWFHQTLTRLEPMRIDRRLWQLIQKQNFVRCTKKLFFIILLFDN